jgi:SAM-dependent methyltransferase
MQVLLRAVFHLFRLRSHKIGCVAVLVDSESGVSVHAVADLLRPWRSSLKIADILVVDAWPGESWLDVVVGNGAEAVSVISERSEFVRSLEAAAAQRGLWVASSDYPTDDGEATAFFHEMAHHLFELGGLNEWSGGPTNHAHHMLQHLSIANCITHFPQYTSDEIRLRCAALGRPLEALDIGCGSISRLRWGALQGLLRITGADPLLDIYNLILIHHGLDGLPFITVDRAISAGGEQLDDHVAANSYDFAYCCNALDHVKDPPTVMAQVARALRPGARFALEFATREGSRQQWQQLHQFDLFFESDSSQLMCQWRDGRLETLVPDDVELVIDRVIMATDEYTAVILEHTQPTPSELRSHTDDLALQSDGLRANGTLCAG